MVTFRDRFFTARTAKALLSWRILVGIAVAVGVKLVLGYPEAILLGLVVYGVLVYRAMPKGGPRRPIRSRSASRGASSCRTRDALVTACATPFGR